MRRGLVVLACALTLASAGLSACGAGDTSTAASGGTSSEGSPESDGDHEMAPDQNTCVADAQALDAPYADGFPDAFVFPPHTVVYDVENRDGTGVIVTAVTSTPFAEVLQFMNGTEVAAGFKILTGETEDHDAEANWKSRDQTGRWAIRESGSCAGETVIQVLAGPMG